MHLRTVADLDATVRAWVPRLPRDIEVVAGVPRSGLLVATLLGLYLNRPVATVDGLLEGRVEGHGQTRDVGLDVAPGAAVLDRPRRVLVVDDTIDTGASLRRARERIEAAALPHHVVYGVAYGRPDRDHPEADLVAERVPAPRVMAWNLLHHPVQLRHMALALEGVLLPLPPATATTLRDHLAAAGPLVVPTGEVGTVLTALPGASHDAVADWLDRNGVRWRDLQVASPDGPTPLAGAYRATDAALLLVGDDDQAAAIAHAARRPTLALATMRLHEGGTLAAASRSPAARWLRDRLGEQGLRRLRAVRARWRRRARPSGARPR